MKKFIVITILLMQSPFSLSGGRLPSICESNNWSMLIGQGGNHPISFYCVLPNGLLYETSKLENEYCNDESNLWFDFYSGIPPSSAQISHAKNELLKDGYTDIKVIPPQPNHKTIVKMRCDQIKPSFSSTL